MTDLHELTFLFTRWSTSSTDQIQKLIDSISTIPENLNNLSNSTRMISDEVSELNQQSLQKRKKTSLDTLVNGTSEEKSESEADFPAKPVDILTPYESPSEDLRKAASQWAYCGGWCSCACHRRGHFKAPSVLGLVLLSFSGRGLFQPLCTESSCRGVQVTLLTLTYFFPSWLFGRALFFVLHATTLGGPKFTLRLPRTIPLDSPIFTMSIHGDLEGIKGLFSKREYSPHDVAISTGRTALHVSKRPQT